MAFKVKNPKINNYKYSVEEKTMPPSETLSVDDVDNR